MDWYIAYRCKPLKGTVTDNLDKENIRYFIPVQKVERLETDRIILKEENVMGNLIFIQTNRDIYDVTKSTDGLLAPYINCTTRKPAVVKDEEILRFKKILKAKSINAAFLPDAFRRFEGCPRVRVRAGEFEGVEGVVFRIRGDRKLIIAVDDMAVSISGIHHTLLELI